MEIKTPFGIKEGNLVHVSEVERGLGCGCVCVQCSKPLVAKKGDIKEHHFAHHNSPECAKALQIAYTLAAKNILEMSKYINLPAVKYATGCLNKSERVYYMPRQIKIDNVRLENRLDRILPDIILSIGNKELMVEVTITHKVNEAKLEKIKEMAVSALEIDLLQIYRKEHCEEIKDIEKYIIEDTEYKRWLYNAKTDEIEKRIEQLRKPIKLIPWSNTLKTETCPQKIRIYKGNSFAYFNRDCRKCDYLSEVVSDKERTRIVCSGDAAEYLKRKII